MADWTVDADPENFGAEGSQAEFYVEAGRIRMEVGYDNDNASITYTLGVERLGQLRALIKRALEPRVIEVPGAGRLVVPASIEWDVGAADESFAAAVSAFLTSPAEGVGPTPLPPPPPDLIRRERSDG